MLKELIAHDYAVRNSVRNATGHRSSTRFMKDQRPKTQQSMDQKKTKQSPLAENPQLDKSRDLMNDSPPPQNQEMETLADLKKMLFTENAEVAPCSDLPDMAQPDTANPDGLPNTKNKLLLKLTKSQEARSEIPREAPVVDNRIFAPSANPKKFFK